MQNFSYIIGDERRKEAVVVDAGWEIDKLIDISNKEKLKIKKIILTHSHYDHIQKVDELASKTDAEVYFHEDDYNEIKKFINNPNIKIHKLKNNDEIKVGNIKIKVIHTPGHTPGAICLLFESLQKLKKLKDDVEVYPGHDYGEIPFSTIGNEKKNNLYFKCESKEQFLNLLGLY